MKKLLSILLALTLVFTLAACSSDTEENDNGGDTTSTTSDKKDDSKSGDEEIELTFMINFQATEAITGALEEAVQGFMDENPNIKVELIPGSADYEAVMKAKMASNDLPDLWTTHGWSVLRYSEYLTDLSDQPWVSDLHAAIEPVVTAPGGEVYVLPVDVDVAGVAYNKDVVAAAGVNVEEIKTWDDLFAAMDKIKANGVTPVHIGGKDHWTIGNFFDWVAPSIFVTDEANYKGDELQAGTFDTATWNLAAELMQRLDEGEYINVDVLTSTYSDSARALGEGSAAFEFFGNYVIAEAHTFNPDANLGFFPVPAYFEGDEPSLISGERTAIGVWKDTPNAEAAKMLLEYLSRPEVMAPLASANGIPAGLKTATSDTGSLADSYELWKDAEAFPYFDRAFLPSGMWDTMCSTGSGLLAGEMTIEDASNKMLEDFNKLYNQ